MTRVALIGGVLFITALVVLWALAVHPFLLPLVVLAALAVLIGGGNALYGKNSPGARAQARIRPAQEAQNRAIDEARRQAILDATADPDPDPDPPPQ
jgi:apolipoprotein N-acyltransferase